MTDMNNLINNIKIAYLNWRQKEAYAFTRLVFKFTTMVIIYGLLINIIATGIFNCQFWIGSIFGYGLLFYFIVDEFPDWVRKLRRAR